MLGASRQAKGLSDTLQDLNGEFLINHNEMKDQLSTLPEQLKKTLLILREMKNGSEPDESADYWEERRQIERHTRDIEDAIGQLEEINEKVNGKQGSIAELQKDIKEASISDIAALERILE